MAIVPTVSLLLSKLLIVSSDLILKVKPVESKTLPCRAPDDGYVTLVKWE